MTICSYCTAGRPVHARGRCTACLYHAYKDPAFARPQHPGVSCTLCARPAFARGYCRAHVMRFYRHGDATIQVRGLHATCTIAGCTGKHHARGYCRMHYCRALSRGLFGALRPATRRGDAPVG